MAVIFTDAAPALVYEHRFPSKVPWNVQEAAEASKPGDDARGNSVRHRATIVRIACLRLRVILRFRSLG